ncbi:hypothetical protein [Variovorax sp. J22R115]|uniref:hypothetical protein n=1 Tax=Variovorax sp. J22R115 TaxID=3053509 RepID=UPI00257594D4|nr:hypothetical protein [Variovorax sp. J22R115]MDM0047825.1 hypothetical protein [Variovorax sp. J22R115]
MGALAPAIDALKQYAPWSYKAHGAAHHQARLALAQPGADRDNPLVGFTPLGGIAGRNALDEIYFKGVPSTPQSVDAARLLLSRGRLSADEMLPMIRILGRLHDRDNTTGENGAIALELKALTTHPDKQVAAMAAVSYARLGYQPGTESVLKRALDNGVLAPESYYHELAHLVASAPLEKQQEYLAELRANPHRIATDVLTVALNSREEFNAASFLKASPDMARLLRANEPGFDYGAGQYGAVDVIRYREWLRASAAIENAKTGRPLDEIIIAKLSERGTDARKLVAYLSSSEAIPLLANAAPDSQVQRLVEAARRYSMENPNNTDVADTVGLIESRMKYPPPASASRPGFSPPPGPSSGPSSAPPKLR